MSFTLLFLGCHWSSLKLLFFLYLACHSHETNIVKRLDSSNFEKHNHGNCNEEPHHLKFGKDGFQFCKTNNVFVQINLMKQHVITALKVAGVRELTDTDLKVTTLKVTTSFKMEYSLDNSVWEAFPTVCFFI